MEMRGHIPEIFLYYYQKFKWPVWKYTTYLPPFWHISGESLRKFILPRVRVYKPFSDRNGKKSYENIFIKLRSTRSFRSKWRNIFLSKILQINSLGQKFRFEWRIPSETIGAWEVKKERRKKEENNLKNLQHCLQLELCRRENSVESSLGKLVLFSYLCV